MKNKTITVKELFKLFEEQNEPFRVKYKGEIFVMDVLEHYYKSETGEHLALFEYLFDTENDYDALNAEIEILDETEDEDYIDVKEDDVYIDLSYGNWSNEQCDELIDNLNRHETAIKQLIRNQKKIIEKLNNK
jgi:hypothetical protein